MTAALGSALLVVATAGAVRAGRLASIRRRAAARMTSGPPAGAGRWTLEPPASVRRRLVVADLEAEGAVVWTAFVGAVGAGIPLAAVAGGPGLAAVVGLVLSAGPFLGLALVGDRRDRRIEARLPEALEGVARALRSGASLRMALGEAAPAVPGVLGDDLRSVVAAADAGVPLAAGLDGWVDRRPLPGVRLAAATLGLGAEAGGARARALDGVAATLRGRLAVAAEVRALSSQARLSGLVIALSPLAFSAVATATDTRTADFLFRTPLGVGCLVLGVGLDAVAAVWMARLCRVEA